jgi:beta-xylosidase
MVTQGFDMPNPFVLYDGGRYYLYTSQTRFWTPNVSMRVADDPTAWPAAAREVMPQLPPWAREGFTWAPDVRRIGSRYVLWFNAALLDAPTLTQCVGVASATSPEGPFEARSAPLVCQRERRGSIDPRSFVDRDGSLWLHWKSDDNADTEGTSHTTIYAQRLSSDGMSLAGQPVRLIEADQPWEGRIVEAPQMIRAGERYWLFYSGNWYNQSAYAIGVAECAGPAGPCTKHRRTPWLASNAQGQGPGESSLFVDRQGTTWIVYNPQAQQGATPTPRSMAMARVAFGPDGPYLAAP